MNNSKNINDFEFVKNSINNSSNLGKGSCGNVNLVKCKTNGEFLALKTVKIN